ncbi:hypothetical protein PN836_000325 [Ningiella sp. W23]|uniref:hypothetical protein n=1 Tax=Ningiella sp. W23 TaxID=3023715 RepID=UPI003757B4A3
MIDYKVILILTSLVALYLSLRILDKKYQTSFIAWFNGEVSTPLKRSISASTESSAYFDHMFSSESGYSESDGSSTFPDGTKADSLFKENQILKKEMNSLRERIVILERIVTEPRYELEREISKL